MKIAAKTDIGLHRKQNQDSYAAGELPGGIAWAVVCDGMGGANGGAVASASAVRMIADKITTCIRAGLAENIIRNILTAVIENANVNLFEISREEAELSGMGTTVVAAVVEGGRAYIAHAGDSRAYKVSSNGEISQITVDHSMVQQLVDCGRITPEEAKEHPDRNIITRAVGAGPKINVDFCCEDMEKGDLLLICTDGLSNYVSDDEIAQSASTVNYSELADRLVSLANQNGGGDNITVVAIAI